MELISGRYYAPTLVSGEVAPVVLDASGRIVVAVGSLTGAGIAPADDLANPTAALPVVTFPEVWNGTNWDRILAYATNSDSISAAAVTASAAPGAVSFNLIYNQSSGNWQRLSGATNQDNIGATAGFYTINFNQLWNDSQSQNKRARGSTTGAAVTWEACKSTSEFAWSNANSGSTPVGTAGVSVKASAGRLRLLTVSNVSGGAACWAFISNKASAPTAGESPVDRVYVPAGPCSVCVDYGAEGLYLSTGVALAFSTAATPNTLTLLGSDTIHYMAEYA